MTRSSADVIWVPADQIPDTGVNAPPNQRHFDTLRQAVCFAMDELSIADRANANAEAISFPIRFLREDSVKSKRNVFDTHAACCREGTIAV